MSTPSISWNGTHTIIGPKLQASEMLITGPVSFTGQDNIFITNTGGSQIIGNNTNAILAGMWNTGTTLTTDVQGGMSFDKVTGGISVVTSGLYIVSASISWDGSYYASIRRVTIATSLSNHAKASEIGAPATPGAYPTTITTVIKLVAGDKIYLIVNQTTGGNLICWPVDQKATFSATRIL